MERKVERMRNHTVEEALWRLRYSFLDLRDELLKTGVPLEMIEISNWPQFDKDDINFKIWDGEDHIKGNSKPGSVSITSLDIVAIVKRQQILRRKF